VGVFEVLEITEAIRERILSGASSIELRRAAEAEGMWSLRRAGLKKVVDGVTTLAEVVRETM
jgi:type IV pilus assembly protein PilB